MKPCDICGSTDHHGFDHDKTINEKIERLLEALHDAIDRPKGVVPDSAIEFYDPDLKPRT